MDDGICMYVPISGCGKRLMKIKNQLNEDGSENNGKYLGTSIYFLAHRDKISSALCSNLYLCMALRMVNALDSA
jgi:hypothetical protein